MPDELDGLATLRAGYAGLERPVVDGAPWPLAGAFGTEPEAAWGPRELLAHVAEMLPFWLGELEKVVEGAPDGSPVPFGRVATDAVRIGLIERDRTLPLPVLFARIDAGLGHWSERLGTLSDLERSRIGRHPTLGEMSAPAFFGRFILGHAQEHVTQLEEILAATGRDPA